MHVVQELCANGFDKEAHRICDGKGRTRFACFEGRKFGPICGSHRATEVTNDACSMSVEKGGGVKI